MPRLAVALVTLLTLAVPVLSHAACDPTGADAGDVAAARAAIDAACDCAAAVNPGTYKRCAKTAARAALANQGCLRVVSRCAAKSTCGRPGAVTCCRTKPNGEVQGAVVRSAELCRAPRGGSACVGTKASVCDACDASGCTATCGDGRLDEGEQCDGQPYCTDCTLRGIGCCQGENTCREAPFFLSSQLTMACSPDPGVRGTCAASGTCEPVTVTPDTLCCARADGCSTTTFSDVNGYTSAAYLCFTAPGTPMVGGACGADGACHPAD